MLPLTIREKIVCWGIWLIGCFAPIFGFLVTKITNIIFYGEDIVTIKPSVIFWAPIFLLLASIPFAGIAVYAKTLFKNSSISKEIKEIRAYGVFGAFLFTLLLEIWSFWPSVLAKTDFLFYPLFSVGTIMIGFIGGSFVGVAIRELKRVRSESKPTQR